MAPHWAGIAMLAAGIWLLRSALLRRARVRAAVREAAARGESPAPAPPLHPSLALIGGIMPPIISFGLVVAGAQVVLAYVVTGGGGFSLLDLAGFLFLLVAYDVWVRFRTRYRLGTPR
jgi:hypothetical protein